VRLPFVIRLSAQGILRSAEVIAVSVPQLQMSIHEAKAKQDYHGCGQLKMDGTGKHNPP
jgi:hypothetical protein